MIRTSALLVALAGLVACGSSNEFEINPLDVNSPEALAAAEEKAWEALQQSPQMLQGVEELAVARTRVDTRGVGHVRYQQLHRGVPVFGGEVIVHVRRDGSTEGFTDSLIRDVNVPAGIDYNVDEAREIALMADHRGVQPTEDPTAQLVVLRHQGEAFLTWKVRTPFLDAEPGIPVRFVDAHTGEVVFEYDDLQTAALSDSDKVTYDMGNSTRTNRASIGDSSDSDLNTTHVAIGQALSFLSSSVGRDSYDDNGAQVRSYGHYSRNYVNAYWDGSKLVFGDGDGSYSNYLGVLDVAGHELAHAITTYTADLTYSYESGALNEATSDIFAAALEASVDGGMSQDTWDVGEDCWLDGRALRYMQYPSADGTSRDHYSDAYTGSSDSGGVHWNSGIANHFFYLLSAGGQHHNSSYRSGYTVQGIGTDAAWQIWYVALDNYMTSSTNFSGARSATESACAAIGYSDDVCHSVSLAWYEVGVGSDPGDYGNGGGGGGGGEDTGTTDTGTDDTGTDDTGTDDTGTTDTGTTDTGTPASCPSGYGEITGTLSSGGNDSFTYSANAGYHDFIMQGASGTDFDLDLQQARRNGRYRTVTNSLSATSYESISYYGSSGDYLIEVSSYSGSGDYILCYVIP